MGDPLYCKREHDERDLRVAMEADLPLSRRMYVLRRVQGGRRKGYIEKEDEGPEQEDREK